MKGLWLVAICLLMTNCEIPGDPAPPVGVKLADGDVVEVQFLTCEGELVKNVRVTDPIDSVVESPEDKVLWSVRSNKGAPLNRITVGEVPRDFEEVVALTGPLPSSKDLAVGVRSTLRGGNFDAYIGFRVQDLKNNQIYGHKGPMTTSEFNKLKKCPS